MATIYKLRRRFHPYFSLEDRPFDKFDAKHICVSSALWTLYLIARFVTAASIVAGFGQFNVTQIMPTHQEEGVNGLFTAFFVSGSAFTLSYLGWYDVHHHPKSNDLSQPDPENTPIDNAHLQPPRQSFYSVFFGCVMACFYSHYIRYIASMDPGLAASGGSDSMARLSTKKRFLVIFLPFVCTVIDVLQWVVTAKLLRTLLMARVRAEKSRQLNKVITPTSEELFTLRSLNQWNPVNSRTGVVYLFLALGFSTVPHSVAICIVDRLLLPAPPFIIAAVMIQYLAELTGSIISTSFVFSLHQSWCDFFGTRTHTTDNAELPCLDDQTNPLEPSKTHPSSATSSVTVSNPKINQSRPFYSVAPGNPYRIWELILLTILIYCIHVIPIDFIYRVSLSPNVFLPFLSFLLVTWPIFRFGTSGTSATLLFTFMLNSSNVCAHGFDTASSWHHHSHSQSNYPVRWMMFVFQTINIGLSVCALMMSASTRQLRELENALQGVVRSRTHQLQQATNHLERQMEDATKALALKSDILATISHEIRTPINGIIGMVELLDTPPLSDQQEEHISSIRSSCQHLLNVMDDILDFTKIEDGRISLRFSRVQIKLVVDESLRVAKRDQYQNLTVTYEEDEKIPSWIFIDATRLKQLLVNLLTNAFKFTANGQVTIKCRHVSVSADEQSQFRKQMQQMPINVSTKHEKEHEPFKDMEVVRLQFSVIDTGIGIPDDTIHYLFQPFGQLDPSSTRQYGGTGLGLVICHRVVNLLNGKIWVESKVGMGSCFHFTILTFVPNPASLPSSTPSSASASPIMTPSRTLASENLETHHVYDTELAHCMIRSNERLMNTIAKTTTFQSNNEMYPSTKNLLLVHSNPDIVDEIKHMQQKNPTIQILPITTDADAKRRIHNHPLDVADVCIFEFSKQGINLVWHVLNEWRRGNPDLSNPLSASSPTPRPTKSASIPVLILICSSSCLLNLHDTHARTGHHSSSNVDSSTIVPLICDHGCGPLRQLIRSLLDKELLHVIHQPVVFSTVYQQLMQLVYQKHHMHDEWDTHLAKTITQFDANFAAARHVVEPFRPSTLQSVASVPLNLSSIHFAPSSMTPSTSRPRNNSIPLSSSHRRCSVSTVLSNFATDHPHSILVVDDNTINRKVLFGLLKRLGYNDRSVTFATNGQEALEMARYVPDDLTSGIPTLRQYWDIILMDIQMPVMDGVEACRRISESYQLLSPSSAINRRAPVIIAVTANLSPSDKIRYLENGFSDCVAKPYSTQTIQSLLVKFARK